MATETKQKSKTFINPRLNQQANFALDETRRLYDERQGQPLPTLYTGISDTRQSALDSILATARGGQTQQALEPFRQEYEKTLSGDYLNNNPYLDEIVRRSVSAAGSAPVSGFAGAGRFGSGAMANAMADSMQSTAASLYGDNYQRERDRMMGMLDRTDTLTQNLYTDADRMASVGLQEEEDIMRQNAEAMRQYSADEERLRGFLQMLQGNPLMAERTMSTNTTNLDYGAMAAGIAKFAGGPAAK